jgi:predicted secreted Zn-dependent protease
VRHEQLHFDIAELSARKLRKKLSELKLTRERYAKQIQTAYDEVIEAGEAMQKAYDEETAHGLLRDEQERWAAEVKREMDALKSFAR